MKNLFLLLMLCFGSLAFSQKNHQTIKEIGEVVQKQRTIPKYTSIQSFGSIDVVLIEGNIGDIKVKAVENIHPYIITKVENNILKISLEPNKSYQIQKDLKVFVPINASVHSLYLRGSGDITGETPLTASHLDCKVFGSGDIEIASHSRKLDIELKGSGDIKIKGSTENLSAYLLGSGEIEVDNVKAKEATIQVKGSGTIKAFVEDKVSAEVNGSGDIIIKGNPKQKNQKILGSGDIIYKLK